jgi:hypothetical protein
MSQTSPAPFWRTKPLSDLTPDEWEALCDGCGCCCLIKLEDEDTGERYETRLACRLLDIGACRCMDYERRHALVPDCIHLDAAAAARLDWLPDTCAYRLRAAERPLYWWHPLISGDPQTVHLAGISVRSFARSEVGIAKADFEDFIIQGRQSRRSRSKTRGR